jgi:hypothetical protein
MGGWKTKNRLLSMKTSGRYVLDTAGFYLSDRRMNHL